MSARSAKARLAAALIVPLAVACVALVNVPIDRSLFWTGVVRPGPRKPRRKSNRRSLTIPMRIALITAVSRSGSSFGP
jgi:hypothetical protein